MISALWWIPLGIAAAAIAPLYLATRLVAEEFRALTGAIEATRQLRTEAAAVRRSVERLVDR